MPALRPAITHPSSVASKLPPARHIMIAGVFCILVSFAMPNAALWLGFVMCGGLLILLGVVAMAHHARQSLVAKRQQLWARHFMRHEMGAGFVTDGWMQVAFANARAEAKFHDVVGQNLADVFDDMLANPDTILQSLLKQAHSDGAGAEDIVTRNGHFRLRVLVLGFDCQIRRLDDLNDGAAANSPQPQKPDLPRAQIAANGHVIAMNTAMRAIVGEGPQALTDIVGDLPLRSGKVHKINALGGFIKSIVVEAPGRDGGTEVFFLPGAEHMSRAPQLAAGWDAIEDLPVPMLDIATDGRLLASNREARHLLGIHSSEARKLADVLDGPGRPINDWLAEAITGRGGNVSEFLRGKGENEGTFVQVTLSRAGTAHDMHLIAVLNDVTELKTLEAQFVQSQKMQAIGQLAGGVAHDFNNLLTAISGHCDLLLLRHDEGDLDYGDLIQIHQNANRAASLVGQLLAFSRKQNLQLETIDLRDTLSDLTHLLNRLVGEKVTLTLEHGASLMSIRADKRQLEQVLMNLVVNARDAMQGAGQIRVVTRNVTLSRELHRERAVIAPGDYVVVSVVDEGQGIAADNLNKVFEPFYSTKRQGEGTGLGLSTAYGIVKQTGGYIFADSELGKGTTFSLYFPSFTPTKLAVLPKKTPMPEPVRVQGDGVVLLVEDEAPVRAFASRALRLKGYTVLEADCAEAALELLSDDELSVDVFVTDVIMPGLDGPTWVRRALHQRPTTKVIFVSGYPEDAFDDGEEEIADAVFLPKPFSLTDLTQTVQKQMVSVNEFNSVR